jgi:Tfp pilus assembly protein PilX
MKHQQGSTLVVALIFLTIITLVSVYSLEGSSIQSKMVANSLFSTLTYQECRNEQEANVRFYNIGTNRSTLIDIKETGTPIQTNTTLTSQGLNPPKSETINISWRYLSGGDAQGIANNAGNNIDTGSSITAYVFEHDCIASFRFATNSQTLGAKVEALKITGKVI